MRLLILTQKVDKNDPTLGFFHAWITSFAERYEKILVICLQKGEYDLPRNVRVISLGKERVRSNPRFISRIQYIFRFYKYTYRHRHEYDDVFVHMNQEYVLLGALPWKIWGKKIRMWRNHPSGTFLTYLAATLSDTVFYTSPHSYTASFKNALRMPVGIDPAVFRSIPGPRDPNRILVLGRITPCKRLETVLEAMPGIISHYPAVHLDIVGEVTDAQYAQNIERKIKEKKLDGIITVKKPLTQSEIPSLLGITSLLINAASAGFMDKTIFEAMACEVPAITSNPALAHDISKDFFFTYDNSHDLAKAVNIFLGKSIAERAMLGKKFSEYVSAYHSLSELSLRLKTISATQPKVFRPHSIFSSNMFKIAIPVALLILCSLVVFPIHSSARHICVDTHLTYTPSHNG